MVVEAALRLQCAALAAHQQRVLAHHDDVRPARAHLYVDSQLAHEQPPLRARAALAAEAAAVCGRGGRLGLGLGRLDDAGVGVAVQLVRRGARDEGVCGGDVGEGAWHEEVVEKGDVHLLPALEDVQLAVERLHEDAVLAAGAAAEGAVAHVGCGVWDEVAVQLLDFQEGWHLGVGRVRLRDEVDGECARVEHSEQELAGVAKAPESHLQDGLGLLPLQQHVGRAVRGLRGLHDTQHAGEGARDDLWPARCRVVDVADAERRLVELFNAVALTTCPPVFQLKQGHCGMRGRSPRTPKGRGRWYVAIG